MMFGVGEGQPAVARADRPGLANNILPSRVQEQGFRPVRLPRGPQRHRFGQRLRPLHLRQAGPGPALQQVPSPAPRLQRHLRHARPQRAGRLDQGDGASAVNELKLGVNRMTQTLEDEIYGTPIPKLLGIEGTSTLFQYNPWVAATGFSRTGTLLNAPNNRVDNTYLAGDTISWNVGSTPWDSAASGGSESRTGDPNRSPTGTSSSAPSTPVTPCPT